jgi:hypothetical protein
MMDKSHSQQQERPALRIRTRYNMRDEQNNMMDEYCNIWTETRTLRMMLRGQVHMRTGAICWP